MKQRFSSLDVQVISQELASELVGLRVSNIYDLSTRIFLFKVAKPDHRKQLIVDSGFRCHVTQYSRATAAAPSPFVARLRKCLKSRRITSINQIGTDRIIDFSFSDGMYHMILEFFASGNIIITDREYNIIALLRQVPAGEGGQEEAKIGLKYTITNKQNYNGVPDITTDRVQETLEKAQALFAQEVGAAPKKSKKKKNTDVLRKALSQGFPEYPPLLLDHAFAVRAADPATPLDRVLGDEGLMGMVLGVLEEARRVTADLSMEKSHPGFIVAKEDTRPTAPDPDADNEGEPAKPGLLYEDFHPFKPRQFDGREGFTILEYPSMNGTVDEYFSSIESQKLESRLTEREVAAKKKLDSLKQEHEKRIGALEQAQGLHIRKADAIQDNVYRVQEAMDAVNGLVAQGMDWVEIARLIEMEQGRGNPVARVIKLPLKLYENTITLILSEAGAELEEEEELFSSDDESEGSEDDEQDEPSRRTSEALTIDIDLGLSPWANATQYYDQKRVAASKAEKTEQSSSKALKSHEKKVKDDLKRNLKQEKQVLRQARNHFWFEKFLFFISSEGYLILGGHDAMQSEMLYRRYLRKGDVFINADLEGATPMIVKNKAGASISSISPTTLSQAGNICVATSSAWDSKAVMSAYWVEANQVSKTAQAGDLLPVGEFRIKGEKNFLAPSQLVLGFAVMWQVSKESLRNHKTLRSEESPIVEQAEAREEPVTEDVKATKEIEPVPSVETVEVSKGTERQEEEEASESDDEQDKQDLTSTANLLQPGSTSVQETEISRQEDEDEDDAETNEDPEDAEYSTQNQPGDELSALDDTESVTSQAQGKRHLSARERRLLRQGKPLDTSSLRPQDGSKPASTPTLNGTSTPAPTYTSTKPSTPVRGRKAKNKKAASKYADQDEDERELALRLLGANKAKASKAAAEAEAKAKREKEAEETRKRRKAQHERAAAAERKRQALFEEDGATAGDDYDEETAAAEAADLEWIPALVGTPTVDDEILAAIPVCAPWAALGRYKYRVKLQPGAVKKGKAVKEILGRWVSETTTGKVKKEHAEDAGVSRGAAEKLRAREGELLKGWKDTEIINTVPVGKVRIMIGPSAGGDKGKGKGGATTNATVTMTTKETTQIASVTRLNKEGPGKQTLAEWWASEQSRQTPEAASIAAAAQLLQTSDIPVAFPTETVYGLGADATRSDAVQGIYRAKQRPSDNPLIVHIDSLEMLNRLLNPSASCSPHLTKTAKNTIPPIYDSLIERFWPGPLTILLPNPSGSPLAPEVTSNLTTFGVRMPASPLARLLIHVTDRPLAAPSANASTKPSPTAAEHVHHDLRGRIELILDGGPCGVGVESTVVDGLSNPPSILRPGGVGIEELRTCPGWENVQLGYHDGTLDVKEIPRAPGMKYRHYSPKARVVLFEPGSGENGVLKHVKRDLESTAVGARSIGLVRTQTWKRGLQILPEDEVEKTWKAIPALVDNFAVFTVPCCNKIKEVFDCHLGSDIQDVARGLFAALRAMDEKGVDVIYVEGVSDQEYLAAAVMNRLRKAAGSSFKV
ncbi:telomere recombination-domain-containing protein [Aspergillus californicus]